MKKRLKFFVLLSVFAVTLLAGISCKSASVTEVKVDFTPKIEYVRNEKIDFSSLTVTEVYSDGKTVVHKAQESNVRISGGDTSVAGDNFKIIVTFGTHSQEFIYSVRNTRLTLDFGDGSYEESTEKTIETPENYTSIDEIIPTSSVEDYAFAGWFYDRSYTRPVEYNFEEKIDTSADLTIYAGYDVDYTDKFVYTIEDGKVTLDSFNSDFVFDTLTIPSTVKLLPVTKIADSFYMNSNVDVFITINNLAFAENPSLEEIAPNAFLTAEFSSIELPASLKKIGAGAFVAMKITELYIPASVERIEAEAFNGCYDLASLTFGENSNLEYIGESAFESCSAIDTIVIPDKCGAIGDNAFNGCTQLVDVSLGKATSSVGLHSFMGCSFLQSITVAEGNVNYKSIDGNLYTYNGTGLVRYCFGKSETSFTVPAEVTDILESAFDAFGINSALNTIILPDKLVSIWDNAFRACSANFVIPKNVRNVTANAFNDCRINAFSVAEDNESFTAEEGILYSKDKTTLIAIPAYYDEELFVLNADVKTIRTGTAYTNNYIKYFVIPENSSLEKIEKGGLILGNFKNLSGVYIEKDEPFELDAAAMQSEGNLYYTNFLIYVADAVANAYSKKWENIYLSGAQAYTTSMLTDYLVSSSVLPGKVLAKISEALFLEETVSSVDELTEALNTFISGDWLRNYGFETFSSTVGLLDGAYRYGASLDPIKDYLTTYETTVIDYLTENYGEYFTDDFEFGRHSAFTGVVEHYNMLPDDIKNAVSSETTAKFAALVEKTERFIAIQKKNVTDCVAAVKDMSNFNVEQSREIYETYRNYGWGLVGATWSDNMCYFRLHCSVLIADFISTELSVENLATLRSLSKGSEDYLSNEYGVNQYLEFYFKNDTLHSQLYKYNEYITAYEAYEEYIQALNEKIVDFDLANFDTEKCEEVIEIYKAIYPADITEDALNFYPLIVLRYNIVNFGTTEVTENNYDEKVADLIYLSRFDESVYDDCGATEEEMAKFNANKAALNVIFENANADLIATAKGINNENFSQKIKTLSTLFNDAVERGNDMISCYEVTVTYGDAEVTTNLKALCATILKVDLIKQAISTYDEITEENFADFAALINDPHGIAHYESFEDSSEEVRGAIEGGFTTANEIIAYNTLLEQYQAILWGGIGDFEF